MFWVAVLWFCWTWANLLQSMSKMFASKGFDQKLERLKYGLLASAFVNFFQASAPMGTYFSTTRDNKILFARLHYLLAAVMIGNAGGNGYWLLAEAYKMLEVSTDEKVQAIAQKLKAIRDEALSQTIQQSLVAIVFGSWTFLLSVATYQLPLAWGSGLFLQTLVMFFLCVVCCLALPCSSVLFYLYLISLLYLPHRDTNKSSKRVGDSSSTRTGGTSSSVASDDAESSVATSGEEV